MSDHFRPSGPASCGFITSIGHGHAQATSHHQTEWLGASIHSRGNRRGDPVGQKDIGIQEYVQAALCFLSSDTHDLHGLIDHGAPAGVSHRIEAGGHVGRCQIVEQNHSRVCRVAHSRFGIAKGHVTFVISVHEDQRPLLSGCRSQRINCRRAKTRVERNRLQHASCIARLLQILSKIGVRDNRIDDVQHSRPKRKVDRRPAHHQFQGKVCPEPTWPR